MNEGYSTTDTALLLVDFLNDFLAEDGKLAGEIGPMLTELDMRSRYAHLVEAARDAGIRMFYAPHGVDDHSFDDVLRIHPRIQHGIDNRIAWKGSYGDDFYPSLAPQAGDVVVEHHRQYNSFYRTDLDRQLRIAGIEKVVLCGHTTHTCVEGSGRNALELGYHVTFLKDAVAEFSEPSHRFAIDHSYPTFGHAVLTIEEFLGRITD